MTQRNLCMVLGLMIGTGVAGELRAAPKQAAKAEPEADDERDKPSAEQIDIGTSNVLERLKLLRVQMALDREEIAALELRIEKIKLERDFEGLFATQSTTAPRPRVSSNPSAEILVKAITLQPQKEAIIMYRGRIFTVREGDTVGGMKIQEISSSGLRVGRQGKSGSKTYVR